MGSTISTLGIFVSCFDPVRLEKEPLSFPGYSLWVKYGGRQGSSRLSPTFVTRAPIEQMILDRTQEGTLKSSDTYYVFDDGIRCDSLENVLFRLAHLFGDIVPSDTGLTTAGRRVPLLPEEIEVIREVVKGIGER
jgi:hypothetical protein